MRYRYRALPQFLNQLFMDTLVSEDLLKAEKLKAYNDKTRFKDLQRSIDNVGNKVSARIK